MISWGRRNDWVRFYVIFFFGKREKIYVIAHLRRHFYDYYVTRSPLAMKQTPSLLNIIIGFTFRYKHCFKLWAFISWVAVSIDVNMCMHDVSIFVQIYVFFFLKYERQTSIC